MICHKKETFRLVPIHDVKKTVCSTLFICVVPGAKLMTILKKYTNSELFRYSLNDAKINFLTYKNNFSVHWLRPVLRIETGFSA